MLRRTLLVVVLSTLVSGSLEAQRRNGGFSDGPRHGRVVRSGGSVQVGATTGGVRGRIGVSVGSGGVRVRGGVRFGNGRGPFHRNRNRGQANGYWRTINKRVWVSGYWDTIHVPARYGVRYDRCGNRVRYLISPACSRRDWRPGYWDVRPTRVWVRC